MPKVKCEICGCEFVSKYRSMRFCDKCRVERDREQRAEYRKQFQSVDKEMRKKPENKTKKPALSINDIIRMSMAAGRSGVKYGEDVMLIEGGKLK